MSINVGSKVRIKQPNGTYKEGKVTFVLDKKGIVKSDRFIIINNLYSKNVIKIDDSISCVNNLTSENVKIIDELENNRTYYIKDIWTHNINNKRMARDIKETKYMKLGKFIRKEICNQNNNNIYLTFVDKEGDNYCVKKLKINNYKNKNVIFYEKPFTINNIKNQINIKKYSIIIYKNSNNIKKIEKIEQPITTCYLYCM